MDVRSLLFVQPVGRDGGPLFKTQLDLAEALIAVLGGGFERKSPNNVRIFINQVLKRPHEPRARPISRNLRRALPQAIAQRVADPSNAVAVSDDVMRALDALKSKALSPAHDDDEFGAFWSATTSPTLKEVVVITPTPAETQEQNFAVADELEEALIERVIIKSQDSGSWVEGASYDFFILNQAKADSMRASLINTISEKYNMSKEDADEAVLSAQKAERLNIYFFDYDEYLPPMCIFSPNTNESEGYDFYYYDPVNGKVSVARKDIEDLKRWKETFYRKMYVTMEYFRKDIVHHIKGTIPINERRQIAYLRTA